MDRVDVAVVGGGQAGLAASHALRSHGVDHVILERGRVGQTWRGRWDSFCLVIPNWTVQLPGHSYDGDDPDGFMPRDEIVGYLERTAHAVDAPVREGVEVRAIERDGEGFVVRSGDGELRARCVVLATGAYQRPHRPSAAASLPVDLFQIDVDAYRNPDQLPEGKVLVVGSGQSGCQVAEELHQAGREVVLSCGRAPWAPRRIAGRDLAWWAIEDGFLDQGVDDLPSPAGRLFANPLLSGRDGGHDLHLRTLRAMGVQLAGHLRGASGRTALFDPDLLESVAWGDERYRLLTQDLPAVAARHGLPVPDVPDPEPFTDGGPEAIDLRGFGAVIFTSGFRPDYGRLVPWPGALDDSGFPVQHDGASLAVRGLFFIGVHFMRKRKSATFFGVGEDAAIVAESVANTLGAN